MKKRWIIAAILGALLLLSSCGATKTLHCDGCGKDVTVSESSNMEEDWLVYCEDCNEEIESQLDF